MIRICEVFRVEATGKEDKENATYAHEMQWGGQRENNAAWVKVMDLD